MWKNVRVSLCGWGRGRMYVRNACLPWLYAKRDMFAWIWRSVRGSPRGGEGDIMCVWNASLPWLYAKGGGGVDVGKRLWLVVKGGGDT